MVTVCCALRRTIRRCLIRACIATSITIHVISKPSTCLFKCSMEQNSKIDQHCQHRAVLRKDVVPLLSVQIYRNHMTSKGVFEKFYILSLDEFLEGMVSVEPIIDFHTVKAIETNSGSTGTISNMCIPLRYCSAKLNTYHDRIHMTNARFHNKN